MDKDFDEYKSAIIIKKSPSSNIKNAAQAIAATEDLRNSMKKNLDILSKWLKESEEIMPRPKR